MSRPEWDIALICAEVDILPAELGNILGDRDGGLLRNDPDIINHVGKDHWPRILAAVQDCGAVLEVSDPRVPPNNRKWTVDNEKLDVMIRNVELILDIMPDIRKRFSSDRDYRIAATIPDVLDRLKGYFREFENTALGLRRLISQANHELLVLIPFIDQEGFIEIRPALEQALNRNVEIVFLTRHLGNNGRNMKIFSELIDRSKKTEGKLVLCEAMLSGNTPISHAKVFIRDSGKEAYIGSANLTAVSMERTLELGVFLRGNDAIKLGKFLSILREESPQKWP